MDKAQRAEGFLQNVADVKSRQSLLGQFRAAVEIIVGDVLVSDDKTDTAKLAWAQRCWARNLSVAYADGIYKLAVPREQKILNDDDGATDADVFAIIEKYLPFVMGIEL